MTCDKKYPCPDCKMCQWCNDVRCELCLGRKLKAQYDKEQAESNSTCPVCDEQEDD